MTKPRKRIKATKMWAVVDEDGYVQTIENAVLIYTDEESAEAMCNIRKNEIPQHVVEGVFAPIKRKKVKP
jgi:hypothetical protein